VHAPDVAFLIKESLHEVESGGLKGWSQLLILAASELEQQSATRMQEASACRNRLLQYRDPIGTAVEGNAGLVLPDIPGQEHDLIAGYVWDDGDDNIKLADQIGGQRLGQVALVDLDRIAGRASASITVNVSGHDPGRWTGVSQRDGDRARAGAQICGDAAGWKRFDGSPGEELSLWPGDIYPLIHP
jgi:hypothetical protein